MARRSHKDPTADAAIGSADHSDRVDRLTIEARHANAQRIAAALAAQREEGK